MTLEQAEQIVEEVQNEGYSAEVCEGYSGRGMYGKTCVGISTDSPLMVAFCAGRIIGEDEDGEWGDFKLPTRMDSLGFDTIIY